MKDNLAKQLSYLLYGLIGLSVVLTVIFYLDVISYDVLINWTYVLLAIAVLATAVFFVVLLIQQPKKAKGVLISLGGLVIVMGLGYIMASDEVLRGFEKYNITSGTSKWVGMGLMATYALVLVSVLGIAFFGVKNALKS